MKELKTIFSNYIKTASKQIVKQRKEDRPKGIYRVLINESLELKALVHETEKHHAFVDLVEATNAAFEEKDSMLLKGIQYNFIDAFPDGFVPGFQWRVAISTFFRRTGCYNKLYHSEELDADSLFEDYCKAFEKNSIELTYLLRLPFVNFEGCPFMDFDDFKLEKLDKDQLANIFQINVNKAFYPWALVDIESMVDQWFICAHESVTFTELEDSFLHEVDSETVLFKYTELPPNVESALKILSLCNWVHGGIEFKEKHHELIAILPSLPDFLKGENEESKRERGKKIVNIKKEHVKGLYDDFYPFEISDILTVGDHPLLFPMRHLRTADHSPNVYHEIEDPIIKKARADDADGQFDSHFSHNLNTEQTQLFIEFIKNARGLLKNIRSVENKWNFIDTALNYFIKAFYADGMEQLLWHIIVLEALFSERKEIQNTLAKRISVILGNTEARRKYLREKIKKLYDYRCTLVHGRTKGKRVEYEHLRLARQLARKTLLWFLNYLNYLKNKQVKASPQLPARKKILRLLDSPERKEIDKEKLLDDFPKGFPNIGEWIN